MSPLPFSRLVLALAPVVSCGPVQRSLERPDAVLLVVVDTLRSDHLGCYGYGRPTSPHIDELAAGGLRFETAIAQAPWTTPSIAALLTSQFPTTLGVEEENSALPDEALLLSEILQSQGFTTGGVVSHSFCSSEWNFDQGFDWFDESNVHGHTGESSTGVTDAGLRFLEEHGQGRFFLWLHYFDPHFAYQTHGEPEFIGEERYDGPVQDGMPFRELYRLTNRLGESDLQRLNDLYDEEIAHTDREIGRILQRVALPDLAHRTVVVFTADHGEEFLDHGALGHAKTLYGELVNVPLILRAPGLAPAVLPGPVGLVDVVPTVLDLLGLPVDSGFAGTTLLGQAARSPVFTSTQRAGGIRAVVSGKRKLILYGDGERSEFFDLELDRAERTPLASVPGPATEDPGGAAQTRAELRAQLDEWFTGLQSDQLTGRRVELSGEDRARLRALGYGGEE